MDWRHSASCHEDKLDDPEVFYPVGDMDRVGGKPWLASIRAKQICAGCPVRLDCLAAASAHERGLSKAYRDGIWGGLTPGERIEYEQGERSSQVRIPTPEEIRAAYHKV